MLRTSAKAAAKKRRREVHRKKDGGRMTNTWLNRLFIIFE